MNIFVTVGTQLPFDRLVRAVDRWVGQQAGMEAFAQIGPSKYQPANMAWRDFIDATDCRRRIASADAIIAHAGMGSIITALELGKPIIVMPRRAELGEHRNGHQLATARRLADQGRIIVAHHEIELLRELALLGTAQSLVPPLERFASRSLIQRLKAFISEADIQPVPATPSLSNLEIEAGDSATALSV